MSQFDGFEALTYTTIPNELLDTFLPVLGEAELKVALFIARKTFGWHKQDDDLSLSQIAKGTGMSKPAIINATASLVERGLLIKRERGPNIPHNYSLNVQTGKASLQGAGETSKATLPELVNEIDYPSKATLPQLVKQVYTQKKVKKPIKEKERGEEAAAAAPPSPVTFDDIPSAPPDARKVTPQQALVGALSEVTGMDTRLNGTRLGKAAAKLASVQATPDLIRQHYGPGGWWYAHDWRGQKGEFPRPEHIIETWEQWTRAAPPPGNGTAKPRRVLGPSMLDLRREREAAAEAERRKRHGISNDDNGSTGHLRGAVAI